MWDGNGGLQVLLRKLADGLAARRPVTVLTWHSRLRRPTRETEGDVTVLRLPLFAPWNARQPLVGFANMAVCVLFALGAGVALRRRWTAALAADLSPTGVAAVLLARLLGRRAVASAWIPGPSGQGGRLRRSPIAPLLLRTLRGADAFVVQTDEVRDELQGLGFPRERIEVIASGVSLDEFGPASPEERRAAKRSLGLDGARAALYCGRFDLAQKRLGLVVEAWQRAALPGWRLVLAGAGPDRPAVERLASGGEATTVLPWHEDVTELYAAADLFVLPTSREGMSRAMIEGMASGLPGVVSGTPGHRRMAPEGVVLAPNDPDEWARALRELAEDDERRAELGRLGRAWVERYAGFHRLVDEYERLLFP